MKNTITKFGLVALLATVSACSCVKTPDLDIAPMTDVTGYKESAMSGGEAAVVEVNPTSVIEKFRAMGVDRVFYGYDSAALDEADQEALGKIAAFIKANNVKSIVVEGHADERGTREYNLALGDRRAVAAKRYLVSLGVDPRMISTISYGKERPAVMGHTEDAWAKNRRSTVVLTAK